MSRNTIILMLALCAGVAGLVVFSKLRTREDVTPVTIQPNDAKLSTKPQDNPVATIPPDPSPAPNTVLVTTAKQALATQTVKTGMPSSAVATFLKVPVDDPADAPLEVKPLPVLVKNYLATTNRDDRLDIMMDIAENSSAETVKALTRLFEAETEPDLKVDLIDSLLGIEGFKEEKMAMLALGAKQGMPDEVRQSAIDGLIDLDDPRAIPILNGLLNDPNEMIREAAQDALEMIQAEPVKLK